MVPNNALRSGDGYFAAYRFAASNERVAQVSEPNHFVVLGDSQTHVTQFGENLHHFGGSRLTIH
jgi:hypothetical protein